MDNGCVKKLSRRPDLLLVSISVGLYQLTDELFVIVCFDCFGMGRVGREAGGGKTSLSIGTGFPSISLRLCLGIILVVVIPLGKATSERGCGNAPGFRMLEKSCFGGRVSASRVKTLSPVVSIFVFKSISSRGSSLTLLARFSISGRRNISTRTSLSSSFFTVATRAISALFS